MCLFVVENGVKIYILKPQILTFKWPSLAYFMKAKATNNRLGVLPHINLHTKFEMPKSNSLWVIVRRRKSMWPRQIDRTESKVSPTLGIQLKAKAAKRTWCKHHTYIPTCQISNSQLKYLTSKISLNIKGYLYRKYLKFLERWLLSFWVRTWHVSPTLSGGELVTNS